MGLAEWVKALFRPSNSLDQMDLGAPDGENPLMFQFFQWDTKGTDQESWWQIFAKEVPRLAELGVSQVWLPPPNKAMVMEGRGYDAYDLWDLGEFDQKEGIATRWGTKAELVAAIAVAKQHNVRVLIDAVLNHKIGADTTETITAVPVDPKDRNLQIGEEREISAWTKFTFPGRKGQYSTFTWNHEHFTGIDWDAKAKELGVFKITQDRQRGWSAHVSRELGNYDYLLGADIDHLHPGVRKDLKNWGPWVLQATGGAGFRIDAVKHYDHRFLSEWVSHLRKTPGRQNMFSVAEFWSGDGKELDRFSRKLGPPISVFDSALHEIFYRASLDTDYDLRRVFRGSLVDLRPRDAVTFVENHDTVLGQSLESPVSLEFKPIAYALILLRPHGYPCVYHADIYGPTVVLDLPRLMTARKKFAHGPCEDVITSSENPHVISFIRRGTAKKPGCVVVLTNAMKSKSTAPQTIRLQLGKRLANTIWYDYLQRGPIVEITPTGYGTFVAAHSVCVYIQKT
ncbi:glycoside hydrolase family 13 protein [Clavulina sp. PMI_390]|nr:glycoside hydrolase family 13 protein [Clavulina sp. PMI_390]